MTVTSVLTGMQTPRVELTPTRVSSAGQEAAELAATVGIELDPWQKLVLDGALGERIDHRWSAFEVGVTVSRQNGKNVIIEARELAGLFLFGEELIIHTAHEFKAANESFRRIRGLIEASPSLSKRILRPRTGVGFEGIETKPTPTVITGSTGRHLTRSKSQRLRFVARTGGSGRGFTGDVVILDEAFNLPDAVMSALMPTMSARPNPQLWYTSSAVDQEIHPHGVALARVRERALAGSDPALAYYEWSADPDRYADAPGQVLDDPAQWAAANPGMGYRISAEHVARERRSMGMKSFAVERLGIGDWPATDDSLKPVIDPQTWSNLVEPGSKAGKFVVFAPDGNPERTSASIAVAGTRADGLTHVEIVERRPGTGWVPARLVELVARWKPAAVVVDPSGPGGSWLAALQEAGIEPVLVSGREMAQACGGFYEAVTEHGSIRHLDQQELRDALAGAQTRPLGDAWAWARRTSSVDISPLVAVTLAHYGWVVAQSKVRTSAYDSDDSELVIV